MILTYLHIAAIAVGLTTIVYITYENISTKMQAKKRLPKGHQGMDEI